jgi:hypothetical protein
MKMVFQNSFSRNSTALDLANRPPIIIPRNNDPRDTLKKNIIKPKKDFSNYDKPPSTIISRSINMFQTGMIENVSGPIKNCSSCGGAK